MIWKDNRNFEKLMDKDLQIIINLTGRPKYREKIKTMARIRQSCILSPLIFNIYSKCIFREAIDKINEEIILNRERITTIMSYHICK